MPEFLHYFLNHYVDVLWLPLSALIVHKGQRFKAMAFVAVCMIVMRLQIEIVQSTGFSKGFTGLLDLSLYYRGLIIYGLFITLFLILSIFSPLTRGAVYLAASLSIFFIAFVVAFIVMII